MIRSQFILGSEIGEQLSTGDIVHQEKQISRILCEPSQANLKNSVGEITYKEWMINVGKNGILTNYMIGLFISDDVRFFQPFHGVELAGLFVLAEHHSAEGASSQSGG